MRTLVDIGGGLALAYFTVMGVVQVVLLLRLGHKGWARREEWWFEEPAGTVAMLLFLLFGVQHGYHALVWCVLIFFLIYLLSIGLRLTMKWYYQRP